jgi:hypothetical protein
LLPYRRQDEKFCVTAPSFTQLAHKQFFFHKIQRIKSYICCNAYHVSMTTLHQCTFNLHSTTLLVTPEIIYIGLHSTGLTHHASSQTVATTDLILFGRATALNRCTTFPRSYWSTRVSLQTPVRLRFLLMDTHVGAEVILQIITKHSHEVIPVMLIWSLTQHSCVLYDCVVTNIGQG